MRFSPRDGWLGMLLFMGVVTPIAANAQTPSSSQPGRWRAPYITPLLLRIGETVRPREIFRVRTAEKVVALTFDDGPSATYMVEVLDVLRREKVQATFFLVGDRVADGSAGAAQRRAVVQRAVREGHEIAFHGWNHRSVKKSNEQAFTEDLQRFRAELAELIPSPASRHVRFFRPPFGHMKKYVHEVMEREAMRVVEADVLPGDRYFFPDYFLEDGKRAVDRVCREARPGSVICLHVGEDLGQKDSVYNAVNAGRIVAELIPRLKRDYRFVRMSELVQQ